MPNFMVEIYWRLWPTCTFFLSIMLCTSSRKALLIQCLSVECHFSWILLCGMFGCVHFLWTNCGQFQPISIWGCFYHVECQKDRNKDTKLSCLSIVLWRMTILIYWCLEENCMCLSSTMYLSGLIRKYKAGVGKNDSVDTYNWSNYCNGSVWTIWTTWCGGDVYPDVNPVLDSEETWIWSCI